MTLQQIQDALSRGAKVWDMDGHKVVSIDTIHPSGVLTYTYENDKGDKLNFNIDRTQVGSWSINESPSKAWFEEDGFKIDCHNKTYAKACSKELREIDLWHGIGGENEQVIHVCLDPVKQPNTVCLYDFFTDRAKWLAHAKAIKERESKGYPQNGTQMYHPQWMDGAMKVGTFTYQGLVEQRAAIDAGYAFTDKDKALALSESFRAITEGGKVVKDAEYLSHFMPSAHRFFNNGVFDHDGYAQEIFNELKVWQQPTFNHPEIRKA